MKDLERALRHPQAAADLNHRQRTGTDQGVHAPPAEVPARGDLVGRRATSAGTRRVTYRPMTRNAPGGRARGGGDRHGNHRATSAQKAAPGQRF